MALTSYVSGLIVQSVPTKGNMKVDTFTADGTFTPPAGVTYAVAHIRAGGGGVGNSSGAGGNSSVAFAGGTITATGGTNSVGTASASALYRVAATVNSGQGGTTKDDGSSVSVSLSGKDGALITAGGAVTAGVGITVTVGAGGAAGSNGVAGGSGYVWIEYLT